MNLQPVSATIFPAAVKGDPAHYSARLQIVSAYRSITQSKYTGPVAWHYPDSMLLAEGNFKSGKPEGKWKHYRYDGSLKSEAFYKNGLLHGESIEYSEHDEGVSYSTYELGLLVFRKTNYTRDSGSLRGTWEKISENAGMRLVHIKTWHRNGQPSSDFYQEQNYPSNYDWCMYNGFEGAYKHLDSNGNIMSQGQYLKGAKVGKWKEQKKNAREVIEVEYPQPDLPGYDFVRFFEEGQPMLMGNLKQGQANGKWLYYNQKGVLYREANFVEGKLSGEEKQYFHSSGKTSARHQYKNGLLHGKQFQYFEEGAIREQYTCINDLKQGPEVIYLNPGVWQTKANYLDGKLHGDYIGKTYQGDTSLVASFREGALEGVVTEYYKEFKTCKKAVGRYLNGFKEGNWEVFDCNGQLLQTCDFEGDNRQRSYHKSYFDGRCVKKE
jgi:antitoxin component YwqK of YwqJK toxin-antitoxin module